MQLQRIIDPKPGFGTHITGAAGTVDGVSPEGFDYTDTGNPSMFFWDSSLDMSPSADPDEQIGWTEILNTKATNFSVGDAYAILIRGDRTSPLNTNDQTGTSTTLRTTGRIHVGDFPVSKFNIIKY